MDLIEKELELLVGHPLHMLSGILVVGAGVLLRQDVPLIEGARVGRGLLRQGRGRRGWLLAGRVLRDQLRRLRQHRDLPDQNFWLRRIQFGLFDGGFGVDGKHHQRRRVGQLLFSFPILNLPLHLMKSLMVIAPHGVIICCYGRNA